MKYDYEEVFERIKYYRDKALNTKDKELLELLISDMTELVFEYEKELHSEIFDKRE